VFDQEIVSSTPGVTKALHIVKFPMVDANGRTIGMGGVATNTTDRIEAEEQLRQAQEMQTMELEQRVADRTRELRDAQEQLVRKSRLEALGQLTATVSHELRNPRGFFLAQGGESRRQQRHTLRQHRRRPA
jgi:signal transduction histidine kinase